MLICAGHGLKKQVSLLNFRTAGVISDGLSTGSQGFDESDNVPAIIDGDGRIQSRLAPAGNAVTDGFEQFTVGFGLDLGTAQISGQGLETLADSALPIIVVAMALGTKSQIHGFAPCDDEWFGGIHRRDKIGAGRNPVNRFAAVDRDQAGFHNLLR
jgi:hypothetical protein